MTQGNAPKTADAGLPSLLAGYEAGDFFCELTGAPDKPARFAAPVRKLLESLDMAHGVITSSLFESGAAAGLSDRTVMTIGAVLTLVFGLWLLGLNTALLSAGWFHVKLALLAGLAVYHYRCLTWMRRLKAGERPENTRWLRWFNEIPVVFLLGIVGLAVAKPF